MTRDGAIIDRLDKLSRTRALTLRESIMLEKAINRDVAATEAISRQSEAIPWSPAATDEMCNLVDQGHSFSAIARIVGRSRNSVIGRYGRVRASRGG